jgi:hypothetical protein
VQKQIAGIAREDEDAKRLMTIPGIDYYSATIIKNEMGGTYNKRREFFAEVDSHTSE